MYKTTPLFWYKFFGIKRGSYTRDFTVYEVKLDKILALFMFVVGLDRIFAPYKKAP